MFPLLGILGLGLAGAVKPAYDEWAEERRGRRATDALAGAGDDPQSQQRALLAGGLLDPATYAGFGADLQRQEMALGPQWGQLGLDQQRFGLQRDQFNFDRAQVGWGLLGDINNGMPQGIDLVSARNAIGGLESSNSYSAVNSETGAAGRFQVMPENIPRWTKMALGYEMTTDQFLADPAAQDAVFDTIFGKEMQNGGFGNAASMWFTGQPLSAISGSNNPSDGQMHALDYIKRTSDAYKNEYFLNNTSEGNQIRQRGPGWTKMTPDQRLGVSNLESGINVMEGTLDFLQQTYSVGRKWDDETTKQVENEWNLAVMPFLQQLFAAGAMSDGDQAFYEKLKGKGFDWDNIDKGEQGKMRGIIAKAKAYHSLLEQSYGLEPSGGAGVSFPGMTTLNVTGAP